MTDTKDKDFKMFYSIAEVAAMFEVNQSLLRFWEKEFPQISPKTNNRGVRQYTKDDVKMIGLIYHLVKEKGMTLTGARQRLKDNQASAVKTFEIITRLKAIKSELIGIQQELETNE